MRCCASLVAKGAHKNLLLLSWPLTLGPRQQGAYSAARRSPAVMAAPEPRRFVRFFNTLGMSDVAIVGASARRAVAGDAA